ncbi:MAG: hypothetical protein N4A72_03225 [Bacteroidales bacterium]|nr:hypothetical protein [Bacteroidales bacterium]
MRNRLLSLINSKRTIVISDVGLPYCISVNDPVSNDIKSMANAYFYSKPQQIPRIIHQVWIGPNKPPWQWIDTFRKKFIERHPNWKYVLWREEDIDKLNLVNRTLYDRETALSGKVNILRYELLYQFGGIYIDADSEWINNKPLDDLLEQTNLTGIFAGREDDNMIANGVIGCSQYNPLMLYTIKLLSDTFTENRIINKHPTWISSGPRFFSETLMDKGITIFPTYYFYPVSWCTDVRGTDTSIFPDSYMMQYGYSTNGLGDNH